MTVDVQTDRERLIQLADLYLEALGAGEPQRLPAGTTSSTSTLGKPPTLGVLEEIRGPASFGVRLEAAGRTIAAIETVLVRGGDVFEPEVRAPAARGRGPSQRVPRRARRGRGGVL
ncbi:MAG: hypothetical protein JO130_18035 [Solirubrobacterales bacterium]|nr:hypothetical protein [Solirubrobacterales bacterium]